MQLGNVLTVSHLPQHFHFLQGSCRSALAVQNKPKLDCQTKGDDRATKQTYPFRIIHGLPGCLDNLASEGLACGKASGLPHLAKLTLPKK